MKHKLIALISLLFSTTLLKAQQSLFINEVMASNNTTIADNTGDYTDWLELYNSNASPVDLDGYYISNDITNPLKFSFSGGLQVPANGYLIIWASNDTTRGHNHLPFKISASGENIYLTLPDGITFVDSASFGKQKTDISYGRHTDGSADMSYFAKPTPGSTNNSSIGYLGVLNAPVLSANAGFYPAPFSLSISSDDPGAQIIYTTNGSAPDSGNLIGTVYRYKNQYPQTAADPSGPFLYDSFRSTTYTNPLAIANAAVNPNRLSIKSSTCEPQNYFPTTLINKGTVVRAVAIKDGYISSEIKTATYFVTTGGINKYSLPILSLATSEDNLFSWDKGIYVAGTDYEQWRVANPTGVLNGGQPANWIRDVEIPASLELFKANTTTAELQTNVGLTINGSFSSAKQQKAFRVYFRSSYGAPNLNYPILPDLGYKNYERLVLSNAGQDMNTTHMRDMIMQACVKHLKFETEHSTPSIAFVNGEFWGLLNIRERYDDNYFERVHGIKSEELDMLDDNAEVKYGTDVEFLSLRSFFTANDISTTANYAAVKTRMDMENFADFNITEIFFGNTDWPGNNNTCWRKRTAYTPDAPYGQDGRFRWVLIDLDRAMGSYGALGAPESNSVQFNTLRWATGTRTDKNPVTWATLMLRKLLTNAEFKNQFVSRYADLINTTFLPTNIDSVINVYRDIQAPHEAEQLQRWRHFTVNVWNDSVNNLIKFADQRPFYAKQHLRDYFSLSAEQQLTVDVSDTAQGFIHVNTIDITPAFPGVPAKAYPWKGLYYPEIPVTLIAKPKDGYRFVRWEGDTASNTDSIVVTLSQARSFKAIFESTGTPVSKVINYWHFNNLPAGAVTAVPADSTLTGNAVITYDGTGAGFMDPSGITEGSSINVQFDQPAGSSLRARNPASTRSLFVTAPTTGYKNIVLTYATTRTTKGADYQRIFYTTDGTNWQLKVDTVVVSSPETNFGFQTVDFSSDANTTDNPAFAVRVDFYGGNAILTSGNDRFDNIAFSGVPLVVVPQPTVSVSADKTSVCPTSVVTFTAAVANAGAAPSYQWKRHGINIGDNSNVYIDSNFAVKDTVYCILTTSNGSAVSNKIIITVVPSPVVISLTKTSASACANSGTISITGVGGSLPYQYSLDNSNYLSTNSFGNLAAGNYTAYIKDAKGCGANIADVIAKDPPLIITSLGKTPASACANDGKIQINRSGGVYPHQYSLNGVDYFTSNIFTNLAAGPYTAYVKDAKGCITSMADVLTSAASSLVITSLTKVAVSACGNNNDGRITINRTGGTSPYQYSLNGVDYFTSNIFSNLAAGTYTVYVKDARGCIATFTDVLTKATSSSFVITSLTKVAVSACGNNNDGRITINRTGGTSPYQYSLNGVNYSTSNVFNNLAVGSYTAYVKDASGCIATFTDVLTKATSLLKVSSVSKGSASACRDDGQITIFKYSGTSPFQYSVDGVNYFSSNVFNNLAAGTYTAYVKDGVGCIATLPGIVIVKYAALVITSVSKVNSTACPANGKLTINRTGGATPYQFSLDNVNYVTTNLFSNLGAGTYTAYLKDARGCITSQGGITLTGAACRPALITAAKEQIVSTKLSIRAYPNPSSEEFSVIAQSSASTEVEFIVTDLAGRKLLYTRTAPGSTIKIGGQLSSGMYFIEALQGKERATLKIVKAK